MAIRKLVIHREQTFSLLTSDDQDDLQIFVFRNRELSADYTVRVNKESLLSFVSTCKEMGIREKLIVTDRDEEAGTNYQYTLYPSDDGTYMIMSIREFDTDDSCVEVTFKEPVGSMMRQLCKLLIKFLRD